MSASITNIYRFWSATVAMRDIVCRMQESAVGKGLPSCLDHSANNGRMPMN